jgi:hypothetical protein
MLGTDTERSWDHFLNPEILRPKLISVSLYLTAFEMLKQSIVERIRDSIRPASMRKAILSILAIRRRFSVGTAVRSTHHYRGSAKAELSTERMKTCSNSSRCAGTSSRMNCLN